jgi:hypothetical protein
MSLMSQNLSPRVEKQRKLFARPAGLILVPLEVIGVFTRNEWFPTIDPLTGKRTGWFGNKSGDIPTTTAVPVPTPQLSKEYIYAGTQLPAVEDANQIRYCDPIWPLAIVLGCGGYGWEPPDHNPPHKLGFAG